MFSLWEVTTAAFAEASKLLEVQLRGAGATGDNATAEPADQAPFLSQLGVAARPVVRASLTALALRYGRQVWVLKLFDKTKVPTDLAEGELRIHGLERLAAALRILATGDLYINSDVGNGADVVVNGGTLKVVRRTDPVMIGVLTATAGPYPVQFVFTPRDADGLPGTPSAPGASADLSGVASGGADHLTA